MITNFYNTPFLKRLNIYLNGFINISEDDLKNRNVKKKFLNKISFSNQDYGIDSLKIASRFFKNDKDFSKKLIKLYFPSKYEQYNLENIDFKMSNFGIKKIDQANGTEYKFFVCIESSDFEKVFLKSTKKNSHDSKINKVFEDILNNLNKNYISKCYGYYLYEDENVKFITDKNMTNSGYRKLAEFNKQNSEWYGNIPDWVEWVR